MAVSVDRRRPDDSSRVFSASAFLALCVGSFVQVVFGVASHAEERVWSIAGEFVEFSSEEKDVVVIRTSSGKYIHAPVASLSVEDRKTILGKNPKMNALGTRGHEASKRTTVAGVDPNVMTVLEALESEARCCRSAKEAVLVYRMFLADPKVATAIRDQVELRLAHWIDLERQGKVRSGDRWMKPEELADIQQKADKMVQHARELLRLGQVRLAETELTKAGELDPDSGKAAFFLGLISSLVHDEDKKAMAYFREAIRREPNNACAHNNLALTAFYARQTKSMAEAFRRGLEAGADRQTIADNIGKIVALVGFGQASVPDKHLKEINDLYRLALRDLRLAALSEDATLIPIFINPYGKAWDGKGGKDALSGKKRGLSENDDSVYVGSGSGFVVSDKYVVTNHHVIEAADEIVILDPSDKTKTQLLRAEVVASLEHADLALLRCDSLDAPALTIARALPGRGTDLLVLGYPNGSLLGLSLKSTRGSLVALPDPSYDGFLHSAVVNPGNSGGPIVDQTGSVIGVVRGGFRREFLENTLGIAIPVETVSGFVGQNIPGFQPPRPSSEVLSWAEVDAAVCQSTVFIQCKFRTRSQ